MHFWGLTIDTLTSILLILSIGLAIDYSAHIGHKFMTLSGARKGKILYAFCNSWSWTVSMSIYVKMYEILGLCRNGKTVCVGNYLALAF